ncbi:hypothetical protein GCM10007977_045390 [Dactylosporangium sucinum]|uniref:Uncharacterized protein n=1 Tax=Dactylosporangium sucinum TaxID=1424081 RepID=A0A917WXK9_9ACTN|nr:hypothetical protein GCM10007977_045390 [Dactylosporangium sucinum]
MPAYPKREDPMSTVLVAEDDLATPFEPGALLERVETLLEQSGSELA